MTKLIWPNCNFEYDRTNMTKIAGMTKCFWSHHTHWTFLCIGNLYNSISHCTEQIIWLLVFPLLNDWYTILRRDAIHRNRVWHFLWSALPPSHHGWTSNNIIQSCFNVIFGQILSILSPILFRSNILFCFLGPKSFCLLSWVE